MRFDDSEVQELAAAVARVLLPQLVAALAAPTKVESVYLTIAAYAARHQVSTRTVKAWLATGLPCIRPTRRIVRIAPDEADAWLRAGGRDGRALRRAASDAAKRHAPRPLRLVD